LRKNRVTISIIIFDGVFTKVGSDLLELKIGRIGERTVGCIVERGNNGQGQKFMGGQPRAIPNMSSA
jgi:hypothetical protein